MEQTVMWTALPNGVQDGKLRLSVVVSPRLKPDGGGRPRLQPFRDFVEWPTRMAETQFKVRFGNGQPIDATKVIPDGAADAPDLWKAMVNDDTYVEPHKFRDLSARPIRSFSVHNVLTHMKQAYGAVGAESPTVVPRVQPTQLQAAPLGKFLGAVAPPPAQRATILQGLTTQLRSGPNKALFNPRVADDTSLAAPAAGAVPPGATVPKSDIHPVTADFAQADSFFRPMPVLNKADIPRPPVDVPGIDFHGICSSLGQYPALQRLFGLVIDLEIPYDASLQGQPTVEVIPDWHPVVTTANVRPKTRCIIAPNRFVAQNQPDGDIANGTLKLNDPTRFEVGHVDVNGAAMKVLGAAEEAQVANDADDKDAALPAMRTGGLWVARANRPYEVRQVLQRMAKQNTAVEALAKGQAGQVDDLYAEDLVRGYRVDVFDDQVGQWLSLCRRAGVYQFRNPDQKVNKKLTIEDEGWVQSVVAESVVETDDDLYLHEALFSWDGWSLVAPRPVNALPQEKVPHEKGAPQFGLDATFTPTPGSLPRLRFGHRYRLRSRAVDLAGNSLPPETTDTSTASDPVEYTRHEPVAAPVIVPLQDLDTSPGESLERIVIRTYNDAPGKDAKPSPEASERHVAPPKTSQAMAERHGMFDANQGMKGDAATYQLIVDNDGKLKEVEEAEQLALPYLPDPLAKGATIRSVQIDVAPGPEDQVVKIPYDGDWPDVRPFRIRIVEQRGGGAEGPDFAAGPRRLIIPVPKAEVAEIWVSSYVDEPDVPNMEMYRWTVDGLAAPALRKAALPASELPQARADLYRPSKAAAVVNRVKLDAPKVQQFQQVNTAVTKGIHWMVTPYRKIILVHAVQQPLVIPDLKNLKALKSRDKTYAILEAKFPISGKSTLKVDILAQWEEPIDPLAEATWRTIHGTAHVVELPVEYTDTEIVMGTPTELPRATAPVTATATRAEIGPAGRALIRAAPTAAAASAVGARTETLRAADFDARAVGVPLAQPAGPEAKRVRMAPRMAMLRVMGPRHEFGDTKYRSVKYTAVATTRFREYFPFSDDDIASGKVKITRESDEMTVDVLSSARPLPPKIRYVIPTFGWESEQKADGMTSKRSGGGLRVYLERPWFSSGDGELLGVVLPTKQRSTGGGLVNVLVPTGGVLDSLKRYVTQTGADPIFRSGSMKPVPDPSDFALAEKSEDGLTLDEVPNVRVAVVGHKVQYDAQRQLWFCDIQLDPKDSYYPFVRLALARYQPKSVKTADDDVKLSRVVLADYAQLAPDRAAGVSFDAGKRVAQVTVTGPTYTAPGKGSEVDVTLETRQAGVQGPLGWVPVPDATVALTLTALNDRLSAWMGSVQVPGDQPPERFRLVVKEYERYRVDEAPPGAPAPPAAVANIPTDRRLVYADVLRLGGAAAPEDDT